MVACKQGKEWICEARRKIGLDCIEDAKGDRERRSDPKGANTCKRYIALKREQGRMLG